MKQLIQDLKSGRTILEEVPMPVVRSGALLIKTTRSLVSLGTERMLVEFGKANIIEKARQQPERVLQVLEKFKTDGILPTLEAVFNKLNQPLPLGYCNVGIVEAVGTGVRGIKVGDRVVSNGNHAEYVCISENLVARIPENVSDNEAVFTVIGSIGLQGIRLANPAFGETVVVIGLGLIGLITAELLIANGCNVIGYDFDQAKVEHAQKKKIIAFNPASGDDPVKFVRNITNESGADCIIITASDTSDEIIHQAAEMSRQRGRIILVGVIGLKLKRNDFYEKELTFQVSCSYGPGRYDENYEQKGIDYPIGFVRWTEKRNFEAVLRSISSGLIDVKSLISEIIPLEEYEKIYTNLRREGIIASLLSYKGSTDKLRTVTLDHDSYEGKKGIIGLIGAGNFTSATIVPGLKSAGASIKTIASSGGLTAKILARKGGISNATSDYHEILNDPDIDTILIATRHNLHAKMVIESLSAEKNVFVEKPLCLNEEELEAIIKTKAEHKDSQLYVGFNRRFAPLAIIAKNISGTGMMNIVVTMNAGYIPQNHWLNDLLVGGGRIIGEACHLIDLCSFLTGNKIKSVAMTSMGVVPSADTENASIFLKYESGSNAVINYFSNGSKSYSKERIEIYSQGKTVVVDNWRVLKSYGAKGTKTFRIRMDKGHKNQFKSFIEAIKTGQELVAFDEILNTTKASFAAIDSLKQGRWIDI